MKYSRIGVFCGAEFGTAMDDQAFYLRIEAKPIVAALVHSMGWYSICMLPAKKSEAAWLLIPYTEEIDEWLVHTIDLMIAARRAQPKYGQVRLELAA